MSCHGITVHNTFLDIKRKVEGSVRRNSSVPCAFKPGESCCGDDKLPADDSTTASEQDVTDIYPAFSSDSDPYDRSDCCSSCTDFNGDFVHPVVATGRKVVSIAPEEKPEVSRVILSLCSTVTEGAEKVRAKLRKAATPFQSIRKPPAAVIAMIANAVELLRSGEDITDVQYCDGGMGGTTMIVAQSSSHKPNPLWVFSLVKDALLNSAEQSESTYILGYGEKPFNNLDPLSFSANIACVPAAHNDTACWDMYTNGCCPRGSANCRWDHPGALDMMRLIVIIKKAERDTSAM